MSSINIGGIARLAAGSVVSTGVGALVGNAIRQSTPADTKKYRKIAIFVGGFVVSSMVAEAAVNYVNKNIDDGIQQFKDAKEAVVNIRVPKPSDETVGDKIDDILDDTKEKASQVKDKVADKLS